MVEIKHIAGIFWLLISVIEAVVSLNDTKNTGFTDFQDVVKNYDKNNITGDPIEIKVGIFIRDIKIDDTFMKWSSQLTLRLFWTDARLRFKLNDSSISVTIPETLFHKLWLPNLFFLDDKDNSVPILMKNMNFVQLRVSQNGDMMLTTKILLSMGCSMEFMNFPFDTQFCSLKISQNHNLQEDVILSWINSVDPVQVTKKLHLTNFAFVQLITTTNSCTSSDDIYLIKEKSCLGLKFQFTRQVSIYESNVFVPSIIAILMTNLSLFLHPVESGTARSIILACSILLVTSIPSMTNVPALYPTALGRWTTVIQAFLLVAIMEFVVVNKLAIRQQQQQELASVVKISASKSFVIESLNTDNDDNDNDKKEEENPTTTKCHNDLVQRERKWHVTIDVLFRVNYLLAFIVVNLRYYFTYVARPDIDG